MRRRGVWHDHHEGVVAHQRDGGEVIDRIECERRIKIAICGVRETRHIDRVAVGSERATYSAAILLPAPVLFSTTTCCRQIWDSWAATIRAVASNPPPAAIGQMMRTTCFGHVCPRATSGQAAAPPSAPMNARRWT